MKDNFFHPTTPPHRFDALLLHSGGVIIATTNKRDRGEKKERKQDNDVINIAEGANCKWERDASNVRVLFPGAEFICTVNTHSLKSRLALQTLAFSIDPLPILTLQTCPSTRVSTETTMEPSMRKKRKETQSHRLDKRPSAFSPQAGPSVSNTW